MDEATDSYWQNNCLIRHLNCDNLNPYPYTSARAETRVAEQDRCTHGWAGYR